MYNIIFYELNEFFSDSAVIVSILCFTFFSFFSFLCFFSFLSFFSLLIIAAVSGDSIPIWKFTFLLRIGDELLSNTNIYLPASTLIRLAIDPSAS